jgi:hypothetical protein
VVTWPACMCVAAPVRYIETPRAAGPRVDARGGRRKPRASARRAIVVMGDGCIERGRGAVRCVSVVSAVVGSEDSANNQTLFSGSVILSRLVDWPRLA